MAFHPPLVSAAATNPSRRLDRAQAVAWRSFAAALLVRRIVRCRHPRLGQVRHVPRELAASERAGKTEASSGSVELLHSSASWT